MKKIILILGIVLGIGIVSADIIPIPQTETDPCLALLDINDTDVTNWGTAYTHSQDNTQAHPDYLLNTGDTASGNYNFGSNALYIDDTNDYIGVSTSSPKRSIHINKSQNSATALAIENPNTGAAAQSSFSVGNSPTASPWNALFVSHMGTNFTTSGLRVASRSMIIGGGTNGMAIGTDQNAALYFFTNGTAAADMTLNTDGRLDVTTASIGTGYETPGLSFMTSPTLQLVGNSNSVAGIEMRNKSTGTSADFRFIVYDAVDDAYFAFGVPGSGNTLTLFGETRSDIATIFSNIDSGGTSRKLAIGTIDSMPFFLGTANTKRITIEADGDIVAPEIYGEDLAGTSPRTVVVKSDGTLGYDSSSEKYKENIRDFKESAFIYNLKPRIYDRKNGLAKNEVGLIAEEVNSTIGINKELISFKRGENIIDTGEINENGEHVFRTEYYDTNEPETVNYSRLIVPLLAEVQKLNARVTLLEKEVTELKKK